MSRKDTLKSLLRGDREAKSNSFAQGDGGDLRPPAPVLKIRTKAGPIRNLEGDLCGLLDDVEASKSMIANGLAVVELDGGSLESSFIRDRLLDNDEEYKELVDSIKDHGQQVPILVRPHPAEAGKFQVVYGHRRVRACNALKRPVKALIKSLSDIELVVAQGQENSNRKSLSYIERANFARCLEDSGFDRTVIMAALNLPKTHLSTLLSVVRRIPLKVISIIGSAPKAGAPRWIALADRIEQLSAKKDLDELLSSESIKDMNSDERFVFVFEALKPRSISRASDVILRNSQGVEVARIKSGGRKLIVTVNQNDMPDFAQYLIDHMAEFYRSFEEGKDIVAT